MERGSSGVGIFDFFVKFYSVYVAPLFENVDGKGTRFLSLGHLEELLDIRVDCGTYFKENFFPERENIDHLRDWISGQIVYSKRFNNYYRVDDVQYSSRRQQIVMINYPNYFPSFSPFFRKPDKKGYFQLEKFRKNKKIPQREIELYSYETSLTFLKSDLFEVFLNSFNW